MKAALIENEEVRLALLRGYNILDTAPEEGFDEITKLAAEICNVPIAMISLVDEDRQWFKAKVGIETTGGEIENSICAHAIANDAILKFPIPLSIRAHQKIRLLQAKSRSDFMRVPCWRTAIICLLVRFVCWTKNRRC